MTRRADPLNRVESVAEGAGRRDHTPVTSAAWSARRSLLSRGWTTIAPRPQDRIGFAVGLLAILGLTTVDALTRVVLIPWLGIVVLISATVAGVRTVTVVAALALSVSILLGYVDDFAWSRSHLYRVSNVAVAAGLGILAARTRASQSRALRQLRHRDELVLASIGDGVYGLDLAGRVTFINPAGAAMVGYSTADLLGTPMHETVHHSRADGSPYPIEECPIGAALRGSRVGPVTDEVLWRSDGTSFPVEYVARPIEEDGRIIGAVVSFRDIRPRLAALADHERMLTLAVAELEHQRVFRDLESALRPDLPTISGTELSVAYVSADEGAPSGGDLYDVGTLPNGVLQVLVVDVMGKGVRSTRDALTVVHTTRTLALGGTPLNRLVGETDRLLAGLPAPIMATVVVAHYDPASGSLRLAGGGHPPPLLVRADARTAWLDAPGRPVGYPLAGSDGTTSLVLGAGDTVLFYTDGLVEVTRDLVAGLDRLEALVRQHHERPLDELIPLVVDLMLDGAERRDDTLALGLRRSPARPAT